MRLSTSHKEIVAACLMSAAGAIVYLISPILVGSAIDSLGLTNDQAGLLIASYFAGYTIITISAVAWLHRVNMRNAAWLSAIAFIASLLAGTFASSLPGAILTLLVGGAGAGMLYGISITIISQSDDPNRYFGIALASQLLFGSVLLFAGPAYIGPHWGYSGMLVATAVFVALMSLVIPWAPRAVSGSETEDDRADQVVPVRSILTGIGAVLVWFTGYSGIYAFIERIGVEGGLSGYQIGLVLSLTILTGLAGALGAAWMGDRLGKIKPHLIGAVGAILTVILLLGGPELIRYSLAIVFLTLSINFWLAYMLGGVAAIDTSGRFAVLVTAALGVGATIGPAIAGGLIANSNYLPMLSFSLLAIMIGLAIIVSVLRQATRQ